MAGRLERYGPGLSYISSAVIGYPIGVICSPKQIATINTKSTCNYSISSLGRISRRKNKTRVGSFTFKKNLVSD